MKSVLLSVQPKWCQLIASGKKTVEIRKNRPQLEAPFKCYIYCTKSKERFSLSKHLAAFNDELYRLPNREIKFGSSLELMSYDKIDGTNFLSGKVIAEFVCDKIVDEPYNKNGYGLENESEILKSSCLTEKELYHYLFGKKCYAWHISDLKIYDKPKELKDFLNPKYVESRPCEQDLFCQHSVYDYSEDCEVCGLDYDGENCPYAKIRKPPQSWCYVEELEDKQ